MNKSSEEKFLLTLLRCFHWDIKPCMSSHMGEQLRDISPLDHLLITCIYLLNFGIFFLKIVIIQCMDFIPQSINYKYW